MAAATAIAAKSRGIGRSKYLVGTNLKKNRESKIVKKWKFCENLVVPPCPQYFPAALQER